MGKTKYKQWELCSYYQEMYELKNTWDQLLPCSPKRDIKSPPDDCTGCPLLTGMRSCELPELPHELLEECVRVEWYGE